MPTVGTMIVIHAIVLVWLSLGLLFGGLLFSRHRGDDEIGVADTQGRDADNR